MRTKELFAFIQERHRIYERKEKGLPKPWTKDPILQAYRFCNVYRERDTVTQWIAANWRGPHANDPDLWFAMVVARLVNWPDTLAELGYPVPWNPVHFVKTLQSRAKRGEKVFSGAYIVSTNGFTMDKAEYLMRHVLTPMWNRRDALSPTKEDTLKSYHEILMQSNGMGSFMAAQVVADIKYVRPLLKAKDWWSFAAPGPGSKRGLNRVTYKSVDDTWPGNSWNVALSKLQEEIDALTTKAGMPRLHAQDLQNVNCEFDKYERTRLGEGRPRSKYQGV